MTRPSAARSPAPTEPLVELADLSVSLNGVPALSGCDLDLHPGESLGVAGPNGAGKSTLLAVVATFIRPSGGSGTVLGARLGTARTLAIRPRIGWSGHLPALYPDLTLGENLAMTARLGGLPAEKGLAALEKVGLGGAAGLRAERCSNGMLRRADLARMLVGRPRLVLLDEPDAGLDREAAVIVSHLIDAATARGGGAICVSHDAGRLAAWTDRVVRIAEGRIEGGRIA